MFETSFRIFICYFIFIPNVLSLVEVNLTRVSFNYMTELTFNDVVYSMIVRNLINDLILITS